MPSRERRLRPLSRLAEVADQMFGGKTMVQYGAICFRMSDQSELPEILLITSRDTGRWVIPKGWGMRGKDPYEVAEQEAWEEAGVVGSANRDPCGYYTYVKALRKGELAPAMVQVHLLRVARLKRKFPETGQRRLEWFSPHSASAAVIEPELKGLLAQVPQLVGSTAGSP